MRAKWNLGLAILCSFNIGMLLLGQTTFTGLSFVFMLIGNGVGLLNFGIFAYDNLRERLRVK